MAAWQPGERPWAPDWPVSPRIGAAWNSATSRGPNVPLLSTSSPSSALLPFGEGFPTKIDYRKTVGTLILTSLLEDLVKLSDFPSGGRAGEGAPEVSGAEELHARAGAAAGAVGDRFFHSQVASCEEATACCFTLHNQKP